MGTAVCWKCEREPGQYATSPENGADVDELNVMLCDTCYVGWMAGDYQVFGVPLPGEEPERPRQGTFL